MTSETSMKIEHKLAECCGIGAIFTKHLPFHQLMICSAFILVSTIRYNLLASICWKSDGPLLLPKSSWLQVYVIPDLSIKNISL